MLQRGYVEFLRTPVIGTERRAGTSLKRCCQRRLRAGPEQTSTMLFWYWLYRGWRTLPAGSMPPRRRSWSRRGWFGVVCAEPHSPAGLPSLQRPVAFQTADAGDLLGESPSQHSRPLRQNSPAARINPGTFARQEALIYAEIVRLDRMNSIALEQYEKAVRLSREGGFNR